MKLKDFKKEWKQTEDKGKMISALILILLMMLNSLLIPIGAAGGGTLFETWAMTGGILLGVGFGLELILGGIVMLIMRKFND